MIRFISCISFFFFLGKTQSYYGKLIVSMYNLLSTVGLHSVSFLMYREVKTPRTVRSYVCLYRWTNFGSFRDSFFFLPMKCNRKGVEVWMEWRTSFKKCVFYNKFSNIVQMITEVIRKFEVVLSFTVNKTVLNGED